MQVRQESITSSNRSGALSNLNIWPFASCKISRNRIILLRHLAKAHRSLYLTENRTMAETRTNALCVYKYTYICRISFVNCTAWTFPLPNV